VGLAEADRSHGRDQRLARPLAVDPLTLAFATVDVGSVAADGGAVVGFLLALIALLTWLLRPVWRFLRFLGEFMADWRGEPERPGVDPRPGVMAKLSAIVDDNTETRNRVSRLERDLLKIRSEVTWLMSRCRSDHHDPEGGPHA